MAIVYRAFILTLVQTLVLYLGVALLSFIFVGLNLSVELIKLPVIAFLSSSLYVNAIYDIANTYVYDSQNDVLNRKVGILLSSIGLIFSSVQIALLVVANQTPEFELAKVFYDSVYLNLIVATAFSFFAKWIFHQRDGGRVVT